MNTIKNKVRTYNPNSNLQNETDMLMIINAPEHKYDGVRATLESVKSETGMTTLHIENDVYCVLPLHQVIPAPSRFRKVTSHNLTRPSNAGEQQ